MSESSMTYQCERCGRQWDDQAASENEFSCPRKCGGGLARVDRSEEGDLPRAVLRGERLVESVPRLPATLALVIDEYTRQSDDYQTLHCMCGVLEITARFLTTMTLADVWTRRAVHEGEFPEGLIKQLLQHLERPTLGSWRVLLDETVKALPGKKSKKECLLPELPGYVREFCTKLGGGRADEMKYLLPMRNLLAHGGRLSDETVAQLLEAHVERFETLICGLAFLESPPLKEDDEIDWDKPGVVLVASPSRGEAQVLLGATGIRREFDRSRLPADFRQSGLDRMLLVAPSGVLDLCPLHAYGEVFQVVEDQLQRQEERALHLYSRTSEPAGIEYTALGGEASSSRGAPSWQERFAEVFQFEAWRARYRVEGALARYSFQERMDGLLKLFIGRSEQAEAAAARIDGLDGGVLWLAGKPGMGKSAFMAKLVRDHFQRTADVSSDLSPEGSRRSPDGLGRSPDRAQERTDVICIPYFFQASDGERCRTTVFAEAALLRLARATGEDVRPDADPQKRLNQFETELRKVASTEAAGQNRKIVIFADGVDEVMGVDGRLVDLVFRCQHPGVVWVCAGRDEASLPEQFSQDRCEWFFEQNARSESLRVETPEEEGLLPPLRDKNVRGYFIEELGHRLPQFFGRDKLENGDWTNEYLDTVIERSGGLPLYLRLLVQDIRKAPKGFDFSNEKDLPKGLEEYYDRIIDRMGSDLTATVPAITTLLALAKAPLPFETLLILLADHDVVGSSLGRERLLEALRRGSVMLRRAPNSAGIMGYTLYHESFRQRVLDTDAISGCREAAQRRLCSLAANWRRLALESSARDYAVRFGPGHLIDAEHWDELEALLMDVFFLEAKNEAGLAFRLMDDFASAIATMPESRPNHRLIKLLAEAFRRDSSFIHSHRKDYPQGLFQCLWNTCWWYDCSDAAAHFREADDGGWQTGSEPWTLPGPKLCALLESWRRSKAAVNPGFRWLRSHRPPEIHLGTSQEAVFHLASGWVRAVSLSQTGELVAIAAEDRAAIWDTQRGRELVVLRGHEEMPASVSSIAISSDGQRAVTGSRDKTARIWDTQSGEELAVLRGHQESVESVAISSDGQRVVTGSYDKTARIWDTQSGEELAVLRGHQERVTSVAISSDGQRAVTGSYDKTVRIWHTQSGRELAALRGHQEGVQSVAISSDGRRVASANLEGFRIWDSLAGMWQIVWCGTGSCVSLSPDGSHVASGDGNRVLIWDEETKSPLRTLRGPSKSIHSVSLSPDGRKVACGGMDGAVRLWDTSRRLHTALLRGHETPDKGDPPFWNVSFSPDGRRIVTNAGSGKGRLWDAGTGEELAQINQNTRSVYFSAESRQFAGSMLGKEDAVVRTWCSEHGVALATLRGHEGMVRTVAYSPDGRRIATGSDDETVRVWDARSGECLIVLRGHEGKVWSVGFSPGGDRIASGSTNGTMRVWDARTTVWGRMLTRLFGRKLAVLRGHNGRVTDLAYSPTGDRIASVSDDQTMRVWDAHSGELLFLEQVERGTLSLSYSQDACLLVGADEGSAWIRSAETGDILDVYEGVGETDAVAGDVAILATGHAYMWVVHRGSEIAIEDRRSAGEPAAFFSEWMRLRATCPTEPTWAGVSGQHLQIVTLVKEGADP